ncbi:MAG: radA [Candidatus Berkelbacteria bacterium]|nr:radA [Candidatus Berkelbacteria bacterium]
MANKDELVFVCSNCGEEYLKWQGKCDNCGQWNTLKEFKIQKSKFKIRDSGNLTEPIELSKVTIKNHQRISTKIGEFDRVLGGGIVPGSVVLLGGDPGIGKSTLLLQVATKLESVLYISGEESPEQIKLRFDRLGLSANRGSVSSGKTQSSKIYSEINLDNVISTIKRENPGLVIIDSIQTIYSGDFPSTPGSLVQVRECALRLQQLAKTSGIPIFLIGHVTKEGSVAGPRILEHLVDVVLYLEGERFHNNRILRAAKNRFGATDEIGIFEMTERGLIEVLNPSKLFLEERQKNVPGAIVTATVEGTRSFLIEVQALTTTTVFGYPQRRSSGFDLNRLQLLVAVLQKRANLNLSNQDIFINIVSGVKIKEPAVDLAVALAVTGAFKNKSFDPKLCVFGELGLSGEIRKVSFEKKRILEAKRLGFKKFIQEKTIGGLVRKYLV